MFVFSAYQLAMMMVPYHTGGEEYDEIKNLAIVSDKIGEGGKKLRSFRWISDKLVQENPIPWHGCASTSRRSSAICCEEADNNEYLTKTFSANDNKLGAIFMDMQSE